jgi:hypothetical protein
VESAFTLMDDYQENVQLRNQQFQESKNFEAGDDDDDDDDGYGDSGYEPSARVVSTVYHNI